MSMCIQHCCLYGSFMRHGSRNFCRGGGGGGPGSTDRKKNSDNVFLGISYLQFYRGGAMVYLKEDYIS